MVGLATIDHDAVGPAMTCRRFSEEPLGRGRGPRTLMYVSSTCHFPTLRLRRLKCSPALAVGNEIVRR